VRIRPLPRNIIAALWIWGTCALAGHRVVSPGSQVTLRVKIQNESTKPGLSRQRSTDESEVVVWLRPVDANATEFSASAGEQPTKRPRVIQKDKSFQPHLTVIRVGSVVEFPNHDPFFHNVFSLFNGKRFDLGLYEAGASNSVRFDHAGVSYIFCNIHPEMSAVVITVAAPFYAISNADGQLSLTGVPYGRYILHVWSEGMGPETEEPPTREITIAGNSSSLGIIRVPKANGQHVAHKNMYGRDYDEPTPNNSVYAPQR